VIPIPGQARIWIAMGHTDMRRGMPGLARQVQHGLHQDVFAGDLGTSKNLSHFSA